MEKGIKKISYKVLPFVLCLCIVSGAAAPAYAAPTTIDQWAQYDGSGWSYNSSAGTFSWNTNMANSSEFVMLSYLRDLYSSIKSYNDNLKSGWLFTSSGYSYPSGWSGSFYRVVLDMINNVNTSVNNNFHSNLQSYSSYPLYSYKSFIDSGLNNSQSFSSNNFIINFLSGISALNTNISYIANQFYADNASGSYNARSLLNQALHKYVDNSQADYTTILNNIKSNTDYLSGIKTDTANLSGIKTDTANLSGIKTDTANLSGIKTDTANLSGIKTDTANLPLLYSDIHSNGSFTIPVLEKGNWSNSNPSIYNASSLSYPVWIKSYGRYRYRDANTGNLSTNDILQIINANSIFNNSITMTPYLTYDDYNIGNGNINLITYTDDTDTTMYRGLFSIADIIYRGLYNTNTALSKLQFVLADDNTIAAKRANAAQEQAVLTNFTGSGSAAPSVSDFGAVKDSIVDLKAGFSGGASSSDTFSFMDGDSNAWDWFTQDTANDLDRTQGSNTRLLRSSSSVAYDTPLLDSYYTSILSILGGE